MPTVYRNRVKQVVGNGTANHKIAFTPDKRVFGCQVDLVFPSGTSYDTMAECMTNILAIRPLVGSKNIWGDKLTGTLYRDANLLHGTTYDFNINTGTNTVQLTLMFAPEWFIETVQDLLALNPKLLGAPISLELDFTSGIAVTSTVWEFISDDLDAPSVGFLAFEVIKPKAAGTEFVVAQPEFKSIGALLAASIYADSGASNEITPVSFQVGTNKRFAHENVSSAQNDEELERKGLTPAASGRTANIYDFVPVKGDSINRAIDLAAAGQSFFTIGAASAMSGTSTIVLARLIRNADVLVA